MLQPSYLKRTVTAADGHALRCQVHGAGPGAPMLLYNGLVSSDDHWPFFLPHFAQRRPVIFWDYRGHGGQPPPLDLDTLSVEGFAEDAHQVARAALQPVIGVGLSFGVQVALEHARRYPADLRALVLICGTDGHPLDRISQSEWLRRAAVSLCRTLGRGGRLTRRLLQLGRTRLGREMAYLAGGAHRDQCPAEVLDGVFRHTASLDPAVIGRVLETYFLHSARDALPELRVPTLILAGGRDELTPVSCAQRMQRLIAGSRLVVYPDHTHLVQVEQPAAVHAEIDQFLRDQQL